MLKQPHQVRKSLGVLTVLALFAACGPSTLGESPPEASDPVNNASNSVAPQATGVLRISVDLNASRKVIAKEIYGVAFAEATALNELNVTVNRYGGNRSTRYNWKLNADNTASDWYFESIPYSSATAGQMVDSFVTTARQAASQPIVTVPTLGWVARVNADRKKLASFSRAKYGAQADADWAWFADAGNGFTPNWRYLTGNNPQDANVAVDPAFQGEWIQHLTGAFGNAAQGGIRFYTLDNEPSLWHLTHRDVHPTPANMEEVRNRFAAYARAIKDKDPNAWTLGPEEWGWSGYFLSGADQEWYRAGGRGTFPDRAAHGGKDYLPWWLEQMRLLSEGANRRLLDVFTVHFYPQGGELGTGTSAAVQQLRNRSTRALWDPNYVDASWIQDRVQLIPRLRGWVNAYYPGTKIGITEYTWGAEGHINGATAQADVLGIFGREGLDLATRWTTPARNSPVYRAFQMYRNYDGQKSTFGDLSIPTTVPDPDQLSVFSAARSSTGALTVMAISKTTTENNANLVFSGPLPGTKVQVWQLTASNVITRLPDVTLTQGQFTTKLPGQSITLFVVPPP